MEEDIALRRDSRLSSAPTSVWRWLGGLTVVVVIAALLALNALTVFNEEVHDRVYDALRGVMARVASAAVVERLASNSPTVRRRQAIDTSTRVLQAEKAAAVGASKVLQERYASLEKAHRDLGTRHAELNRASASRTTAVKSFSDRLFKRIVRNAGMNVSAVVAESIPVVGVAITLGVTTVDVLDACNTIKDMNSLGREFGGAPADHTKVCGLPLPTTEEVLAQVKKNSLSAYRAAAESLNSAKVDSVPKTPPNVTLQEIKAAACPIVKNATTECRL